MALSPDQFVATVKTALPSTLRSAVLYGSATSGDFLEGSSSYDLLLVFERLGHAELEALRKPIRRWVRAGNRPPRLFVTGELAASIDAFPIELMDLCRSRKILYGDDPFDTVQVPQEPLRLQLERELKGRLLDLRDDAVIAAGRRRALRALMVISLSPFLVLFRAAARLFESDVPPRKLEAVDLLARHLNFDPQVFHRVHDLKRGLTRDVDILALFDLYLSTIEHIVATIDRHSPSH